MVNAPDLRVLFYPPTGCNSVLDGTASAQNGLETDGTNEEYTLMSIDTIINGKVRHLDVDRLLQSDVQLERVGLYRNVFSCCCEPFNVYSYIFFHHQDGVFQGLIPILNCYLENMEVDVDTRCTILNYLKLIKKRASGKYKKIS